MGVGMKTISTDKLTKATGGYGPWDDYRAARYEAHEAYREARHEAWAAGYGGYGPPPGYGGGYAYHYWRRGW
jgi:hypothetical protein